TYPARPLAIPPRIAGEPMGNLLELLKDPIIRTRHHARMELRLHPKKEVVKALGGWVAGLDANDPRYEHHLLEALWVHQHHHAVNQGLLVKVLNARDPRARAAATRVLSFWGDDIGNPLSLLRPRIADAHARVRAEALRAVSYIDTKEAVSVALDIMAKPMDKYLNYLLGETMRVLDHHLAVEKEDGTMQAGVLLDKTRNLVDYQLGRLSVDELLALERPSTNPRYEAVHEAILKRSGMILAEREASVAALARSNKTDVAAELTRIIQGLDGAKASGALIVDHGKMLLPLDGELLLDQRPALEGLAKGGKTPAGRQMGYAALMNSRFMEEAWTIAGKDSGRLRDLLGAVSALTSTAALDKIYDRFLPLLDSKDATLRDAAIQASTSFPNPGEKIFAKLVSILESGDSTHAAIQALHRMHTYYWYQGMLPDVVRTVISFAQGIPVADRNKAPFLDAVHLVKEMSTRFL
ncbi:MAG: HEAT repeat domain-containing protein, partial [Verrucomicrobiales bacterium]